jgi:hypothetical protein
LFEGAQGSHPERRDTDPILPAPAPARS